MSSIRAKVFFESILRLTRVWNLLIIAFAQYFTAWFLIGKSYSVLTDMRFFFLCISTVLIAAAGYIINDYYDVKIDLINKPKRVVVGKGITRRFAILFHVVFSTAGILIGGILSWRLGLVNLFCVFLLWLYSNNLKRLPFIGNFTVALLTGISIYCVDIFYHTGNALVIIYAAFSFFMTLVREIIKDMEDLKGDNTFGCKTLPIVWGVRKTKIVIYATLVFFSTTVLVLNQYYAGLQLYYFLIFLFIPLLILLARLIRADTIKDYAWLSSFCKLIMLLGILSMAFV